MNKIFEGIEAKSKGKNVLKEFPTMPHGWMAARGDVSGLSESIRSILTYSSSPRRARRTSQKVTRS